MKNYSYVGGVTMNRNERAKTAQETLDIFKDGRYCLKGSEIMCQSKYDSEFLSERELSGINMQSGNFTPQYEVINESVVDTVLRFGNEYCGVLNFASAKNPGGGFLNGSIAQEEALAISSDLYNSQLHVPSFYDINKRCNTALYTHNMIYSRNVTFIRDGKMNLLASTGTANVLTSPAVNAGAYYKNENGKTSTVLAVMETRMRYILNVFAAKGDRTIILGAYGCGVFNNDTADVAETFYKLLAKERLEKHFERIVFTVYDPKGYQFNLFKQRFSV
jgi:uncharacterized protein (TIGR02452 family)